MIATHAPLCAAPDPNPNPPSFAVPPNATDCHVHVFGPAARYPYQDERSYTPPDSPPDALFSLHRALGVDRAVIVQASVHGTDNSAVLDAVARAPDRLRAVASVGKDVTDAEIERLHLGGVRGLRVNLVDRGGMPFSSLDEITALSKRIRPLGWHIEFLVHVEEVSGLLPLIESLAVPAVVGHLGYAKAAGGVDHPGYQRFLDMVREGRCWVKLTGPYRISSLANPPYEDVLPYAEALLDAAPSRLLWGSDWPHVMQTKPMPNDGELLDLLARWVPDPELRQIILVDNPASLYGFETVLPNQKD